MYIKQVIENRDNWGYYLLGILVIIPITWIIFQIPFTIALTDAIVEPIANSVWYFILDKWWASKSK